MFRLVMRNGYAKELSVDGRSIADSCSGVVINVVPGNTKIFLEMAPKDIEIVIEDKYTIDKHKRNYK